MTKAKLRGCKGKEGAKGKGCRLTSRPVGVIYSRTSSPGTKLDGSTARQKQAARQAAKAAGVQVGREITDVVSGSLPLQRREVFRELLAKAGQSKRPVCIFVESARAVSRDSVVAEQVFRQINGSNVSIVCRDMPTLFSHTADPAAKFCRQVMCAREECDKDTVVLRLRHGLEHAKTKSKRTTQNGSVKVNGAKTILEQIPLPLRAWAKLKAEVSKYKKGQQGLRPLASGISKVIKRQVHHETARRMVGEIEARSKMALKRTRQSS